MSPDQIAQQLLIGGNQRHHGFIVTHQHHGALPLVVVKFDWLGAGQFADEMFEKYQV